MTTIRIPTAERTPQATATASSTLLHNIGAGDGSDDDDDVPWMQLLGTRGDRLHRELAVEHRVQLQRKFFFFKDLLSLDLTGEHSTTENKAQIIEQADSFKNGQTR
jgi:hypothetical protein